MVFYMQCLTKMEKKIFDSSVKSLKPKGLVCIEVRSINDRELKQNSKYNSSDRSFSTSHKRWLYDKKTLLKLAQANNLEIVEFSEDFDYSITSHNEKYISNPLLIRFVARKN